MTRAVPTWIDIETAGALTGKRGEDSWAVYVYEDGFNRSSRPKSLRITSPPGARPFRLTVFTCCC